MKTYDLSEEVWGMLKNRLERILKKHVQSAPVRAKILYEMFGD